MLNQLSEPIVRGCEIVGCSHNGVFIQLCKAPVVERCSVRSSGRQGLTILYSNDARVSDNLVIRSGTAGIVLGGGANDREPNRGFVVRDNRCVLNGSDGIVCDPTISGRSGVPVPSDGMVTGNVCRINRGHGIVLTCAKDMRVDGNECVKNAGSGIALATSNTVLTNNTCERNERYGIAVFGGENRPNYGKHRLEGNRASGNRVSDVFVQSPSIPDVTVIGQSG